jgi:hypothetical protein
VTITDRSEALTDLDRLAQVCGRGAITWRPTFHRPGRRVRRSCIIVGSGRSGASMVAGTLQGLGYFMGDNLPPGAAPFGRRAGFGRKNSPSSPFQLWRACATVGSSDSLLPHPGIA